jgi:hypothetical protein
MGNTVILNYEHPDFKNMTHEEKLFNEVCERCESYGVNFTCEDMIECPAYKLYEMAKANKKTIHKKDTQETN